MKTRAYAYVLGLVYRIEAAIKEAQLNDRIRDRNERNEWFVGAVALVLVGLSAPACVPRHVDREITAEHRRCSDALNAAAEVSVEAFDAEVARCHANIDRIHP